MKKIIITKRELKEAIFKAMTEDVMTDKSVMHKYYGYRVNAYEPILINESSINRILNKHGNEGMAIISANRPENDNRTNNENTRRLIGDIKSTKRSYIPVYGGYKGTDGKVDEFEPSFIVTNYDRNGVKQDINELFNFAIEMCGKYRQDSVLFKYPDKTPNYYDDNGVIMNKSSSNYIVRDDLTQQYFTSLIKTKNIDTKNPERSKRFTYDIQFEGKTYGVYLNPSPTSITERMKRTQGGELLIQDGWGVDS